jgi:hypothetical protein
LDFKKFVVDQLDWGSLGTPANSFFSTSVTGGADIPTNSPDVINYNGLAYSQSALATDGSPLESLPQNPAPLTPSIYQGLQFYSSPSASGSFIPKNIDTSKYTQSALSILNAEQHYFAEDSSVYAVDQSGVVYRYILKAPDITPSLQNTSSEVYSKYSVLLPGGCGVGPLYVLQNISDADLVPIVDQISGISIYGFKDPNHPLTAAEYADKILIYDTNSGMNFSDFNNEMAPSNLQQYAAKNPVLIFKDPWGRYVGVGEYEYNLPGGCGKPVIYLYPQHKEDVTVQLKNTTFFNIDIPTYDNGWNVSAGPDGQLTDLRAGDTNCDKINYSLPGLAYAKQACKTGMYPYLYWSGSTLNSIRPDSSEGWVVSRDNLQSFLQDKTAAMGFSSKESIDMISYWLPEMLSKTQPYFKINFYQTADMDKFIPLIVTPKPDTELRMFMNWSPLDSKPIIEPQPESLIHVQRKGFMLVEWGGLKQ